MCDLNVPGPTPRDSNQLAQRALACEISGDLERAVALIRCLQQTAGDARLSPYRRPSPRGGARRMA